MLEILGSIWWLIVALGLLVTFHEFGHYWVARRCGVKVLRFSVGFGKALWKRTAKDGTEWQVAALPLGGYVKMLDEREGPVAADELDQAFNRKPVGQRFAIVVAGPVFNLVFAVFAFWLMFAVGIPESRPIVGEVTGIAAEAGIQPEDEIIALDGDRTRSWSHAILGLVTHALDRDQVNVELEDLDGERRQVTLDLGGLGDDFEEEQTLEAIGIAPWRPVIPAIIGEVTPDSPAQAAGLRAGDRITAIGGEPVEDWSWVPFRITEHAEREGPIAITVDRSGIERIFEVTPQPQRSGLFGSRPVIGIVNQGPDDATRAKMERAYLLMRHGPVDGFGAAVAETWRLTGATLGLLGRMITGSASVSNISGPIGIAQFANSSANAGLSNFLFFLGLISLSLGILNLLPIPVLDGGHLLYYLIEWVKGSPVSDQAQIAGQYIGLVALFGLMSLGIINDILRLVS
ncbi:RIP metalloprotease RseP [Marinihelvus fidelis]|uniref:Zinc metalloprotease n=1 Tax=Marinihelvus fidelis TaxID=2613842 RepID=A0A5N0T3F8_9GAMM|nr:RIP metalloprotease RseP [Marinihelvus fidelis]KAA9129605.1 RIP metalloprotease RseP [Marinihelvus fidelis]